jgi:hypothetical protein
MEEERAVMPNAVAQFGPVVMETDRIRDTREPRAGFGSAKEPPRRLSTVAGLE